MFSCNDFSDFFPFFCYCTGRTDNAASATGVTDFRKNNRLFKKKSKCIKVAEFNAFSAAGTFILIKVRKISIYFFHFFFFRYKKKMSVRFFYIAVKIKAAPCTGCKVNGNECFSCSAFSTEYCYLHDYLP